MGRLSIPISSLSSFIQDNNETATRSRIPFVTADAQQHRTYPRLARPIEIAILLRRSVRIALPCTERYVRGCAAVGRLCRRYNGCKQYGGDAISGASWMRILSRENRVWRQSESLKPFSSSAVSTWYHAEPHYIPVASPTATPVRHGHFRETRTVSTNGERRCSREPRTLCGSSSPALMLSV